MVADDGGTKLNLHIQKIRFARTRIVNIRVDVEHVSGHACRDLRVLPSTTQQLEEESRSLAFDYLGAALPAYSMLAAMVQGTEKYFTRSSRSACTK